jgi:hypothetical protein
MNRNTWNDDEELPRNVTIRIVVHDFYLRNRMRMFWAASLAIAMKFFPFDYLGRVLNRLSTIIIIFFNKKPKSVM